MSTSQVQIKVQEAVGTITLNRPDKRNALTRELIGQLDQAFDDLHQERRVRVVVLTGAGSAFCAGMDLDQMRETAESDQAFVQWGKDAEIYRDLLLRMLRFPKPIIAMVNGPAVAGGAGLALASDIVLGTPEARFGLPGPRRGIVAGMVAPLLVFRIGAGHAARLLLQSSLIAADEAYRLGLYHEMVGSDEIESRTLEVAAECAKGAPESLQLTKHVINETIGEHLATLIEVGAAASATARTTEAAAEGLQAFLEKREPNWP